MSPYGFSLTSEVVLIFSGLGHRLSHIMVKKFCQECPTPAWLHKRIFISELTVMVGNSSVKIMPKLKFSFLLPKFPGLVGMGIVTNSYA